jgi:hypothetical protein
MMDYMLCYGPDVIIFIEPVKIWEKQTGVCLMERNLRNKMLIMESFK